MVEAAAVDANGDARMGGAGAANDRRLHPTDERSDEGWWRRRESFFRVLLSHRMLREVLKKTPETPHRIKNPITRTYRVHGIGRRVRPQVRSRRWLARLSPPMPPLRASQPFDHPDWIFELKHDGFHALAIIEGHRCRLVSRQGHQFWQMAQLAEELAHAVRVERAVLDGEIVCLRRDGNSDFSSERAQAANPP
jgi:ATP-dependent DNA ligase